MIDDETLDRQLREAVPYINDDGFTSRVIARLPAARREPQWLRAMIVVGLALIGTGMAYFLSGGGSLVRQGVVQMATSRFGCCWSSRLVAASWLARSQSSSPSARRLKYEI